MDKDNVVYRHSHTHTYSGILLSHKKKEIMPFAATRKDLEIIILREVRKIRKISYGITNTTYMWNLKMIQMNLFTK